MLLTVKFIGHEFRFYTIKRSRSKVAVIHKNPSPTTIIELIKLKGSINFYSKFIHKHHVNMKFMYGLLHDITKFHRKIDLERLF